VSKTNCLSRSQDKQNVRVFLYSYYFILFYFKNNKNKELKTTYYKLFLQVKHTTYSAEIKNVF